MRSFCVILAAALGCAACRTPQERARNYMSQGDVYAAAGRPDAAAIEYRNAIKQTPDIAIAYRKLGDAYVAAGNADEAFRAFARASALDPEDTHSPLASVRLLLAAGNDAEAHARAEAMLERSPDDVEAQTLVGITLARLQRLPEAEVQLAAAGARDTTGEALTALGEVKQASGDRPGAEAAFRGAVLQPRQAPPPLASRSRSFSGPPRAWTMPSAS